MQTKRAVIFYPILLIVYFYFHFYSLNITTLLFPTATILKYLVITLLVTAVVWLALTRFWGDAAKAGVYVAVLLLLFFSYGHVYDLLFLRRSGADTIVDPQFFQRSHGSLLGVWVLLAVAALMITIAKGYLAHHLTTRLNIVTGVLCLFPVMTLLANNTFLTRILSSSQEDRTESAEAIQISSSAEGYSEALPDIYYIILDAYAREDTLASYYDYDNTFVEFLESRGFYVASESDTNYPLTLYSLPSSLNMRYLIVPDDTVDAAALQGLIEDPAICRALREIGYEVVVMETIITGVSKCADVRIANVVNNLDTIFLRTTLLRPLLNQAAWGKPTYQNHLDRIDALLDIPDMDSPTFTFAHFILPHDPYVFDREGNQVFYEHIMGPEAREPYLDQLIYTNVLFENVVDQLLAESEVPPIIIIQGDHGPGWTGVHEVTPDYLATRIPILNAYHFPHGGNDDLYPSISPVNSFRVLLNYYFDADLELLEDRTYFMDQDAKAFVDITIPLEEDESETGP